MHKFFALGPKLCWAGPACVRIQHCYREANKCADAVARRGALLSQDFSILIDPPPDVAFLLSLDSARALYDRFVPSVLEAG